MPVFSNAQSSIKVTVFGILISVKSAQPEKAPELIISVPLSLTEANLGQSWNNQPLNSPQLLSSTDSRFGILANAQSPTLNTLLTLTEVKAVPYNDQAT